MSENNYCVYRHRNLTNGKFYIGITKQNPERRWRNGEGYIRNEYFTKAIQKYGWDGFEHKILYNHLSKEQAEEIEILLIAFYNSSYYKNGYNIETGGSGKNKITYSTRKKMSESRKGRVISEEQKEKLRKSSTKMWENPKIREKILNTRKKNGNEILRATKVYCEGKEFQTVKECAEYYNIPYSRMFQWVNGNMDLPKEWFDKGLHKEDKTMENYKIQVPRNGKDNKPKKVYCEDKEFPSSKECAEYYGTVKRGTMANWLNGKSPMPQEWYDKGLRQEGKQMTDYKIQKRKQNKINNK